MQFRKSSKDGFYYVDPDSVKFVARKYEEPIDNRPDLSHENFTETDNLYLYKARLENLQEQIGKSVDEIVEMKQLESIINENPAASSLGIPTKEQKFISALEDKRTSRYSRDDYDGKDTDQIESSKNEYYMQLFKDSYLNTKSFKLLCSQKNEILDNDTPLSFFKVFKSNPRELTLEQYIAKFLDMRVSRVIYNLQSSPTELWDLKQKWITYLARRKILPPSKYQRFLQHVEDLMTSPIYEDIETLKKDHHRVSKKYELIFKDKSVKVLIPIEEFNHILKNEVFDNRVRFIELSYILPIYAREKERFFRKGGHLIEFRYLLRLLDINLSHEWQKGLEHLFYSGNLKLYREVLEVPGTKKITGYYLNITKELKVPSKRGFTIYSKEKLTSLFKNSSPKEMLISKKLLNIIRNYLSG